MLIQELLRTCANQPIAAAAVASIGLNFFAEVEKAAAASDMTVGEYAAEAVTRFSRRSGEAELQSVAHAMASAQEPILTGLHRLLCIMLVADGATTERRVRERVPQLPPYLCAIGIEARRNHLR